MQSEKRRLGRAFAILIACVVVVVAAIGAIKFFQIKAGMAMATKFAPPPAAVSTYVVSESSWQPSLDAIGTVEAVNGVVVSTDLPGIVREIIFESGKPVEKGAELIKLDTTQETAQLNAAMARLELARINRDRNADLLKKRVASQSDYDSAIAEYRQATAAVNEIQATIERKTVRAPFSGLLGIRQVNLGEYLNSGDPVVPLQSLDPIYVDFSLPQQALGEIQVGRTVEVHADGLSGEKFEGVVSAIDPQVDSATRNVKVQATLRNPDGKLRSGMFVNVQLLLPAREKVVSIPATAVNYAPFGDSVFLVEDQKSESGTEQKVAVQKFIKLGASRGDLVEITDGLTPGDTIVAAGTFKLKNNAPVQINNDVRPEANPNPTPADS